MSVANQADPKARRKTATDGAPRPERGDSRASALGSGVSLASFALAIALSPVAMKLPLGPVSLTPSDLLMALTIVPALPWLARAWRDRRLWDGLTAPSLFIFCCALSAVAADDRGAAMRELAQLVLYVAGAWAVTRRLPDTPGRPIRRAVSGACLLSIAAGLSYLPLGYKNAFGLFGAPSTLAASVLAWSAMNGCLAGGAGGRMRRAARLAMPAAALAALAVAARVDSTIPRTREPVAQRYLEAYAGLSAVAAHPLTGVGPGNYQAHIGEYYQGMPKDNTLPPGSGIGYAILPASAGLPALCAFLYWLHALWRRATGQGLRAGVAAVAAGAILSPIFLGTFLLPLALIQGMLHREEPHA